jgi:hypothetical protein
VLLLGHVLEEHLHQLPHLGLQAVVPDLHAVDV